MIESRRYRRIVILAGVVCTVLLLTTEISLRADPTIRLPSPILSAIPKSTSSSQDDFPTSQKSAISNTAGRIAGQTPSQNRVGKPAPHREGTQGEFSRYGLSSKQCSSAFADLYKEIDHSVALRRKIGNVIPEDIDLDWKSDGAVRAMIYNQKLYILEWKIDIENYVTRALGALHQIDRAITASPEPVPNIEFSFVVENDPNMEEANRTFWALTKRADDETTWLMPDFGYWSWPLGLVGSYEQILMEMAETEVKWEDKIRMALWRGTMKTNKVRAALMAATRDKEWADVGDVKWKNRTNVQSSSIATAMSIVDHCAYEFLIHTEGQSYSGRGKYLLNCNSVFITHKREWVEPHHSLLISSGPQQNFVEVERDFSDLEEKVQQLLDDPERSRMIANNSVTTFRDRYLTPAAQACYWRQLFSSWAEVSFQPGAWEFVGGKRRLRGIPFETFVVTARKQPDSACPLWKKVLFQC